MHLFSDDLRAFPYHANAPYKPPAMPLEAYLPFLRESGIDHVVIVQPEPYQDDQRYLEYCFQHEPSPGFFKGTCLFDPISPATAARMETLMKRNPGRIVALRIHAMHDPKTPPSTGGPIRDRDLRHPAMRTTWENARSLGLAIQMHFLPCYAPQIGELAARFPDLPVLLDHLGRAGQGSAAEFQGILDLARLPHVHMKCSVLEYSSKQDYPYRDVKQMVCRAFDAFGPDRMLWGYLGTNMEEFRKEVTLFDYMFDFASETDRAKIRGSNAVKLFRFRA